MEGGTASASGKRGREMRKTSACERAKLIDDAMRMVWVSLESHLTHTHSTAMLNKKDKKETCAFHKKCVRDYVELMSTLSKLY